VTLAIILWIGMGIVGSAMALAIRRIIYFPDSHVRRRATIWIIVMAWVGSGVGILAGIGTESAFG
jgi:hypothetical protein